MFLTNPCQIPSRCVCRYLEALKFMLDPNTKSIFETEVVDPTIVNKRKRTAIMLCFTSPHFTMIAKEFGLEEDAATGLAVPRAQRPQTAQVITGGLGSRGACLDSETAR